MAWAEQACPRWNGQMLIQGGSVYTHVYLRVKVHSAVPHHTNVVAVIKSGTSIPAHCAFNPDGVAAGSSMYRYMYLLQCSCFPSVSLRFGFCCCPLSLPLLFLTLMLWSAGDPGAVTLRLFTRQTDARNDGQAVPWPLAIVARRILAGPG